MFVTVGVLRHTARVDVRAGRRTLQLKANALRRSGLVPGTYTTNEKPVQDSVHSWWQQNGWRRRTYRKIDSWQYWTRSEQSHRNYSWSPYSAALLKQHNDRQHRLVQFGTLCMARLLLLGPCAPSDLDFSQSLLSNLCHMSWDHTAHGNFNVLKTHASLGPSVTCCYSLVLVR